MEVVLDASVIVKWYSNEQETSSALRLLQEDKHRFAVPDIAAPEVLNALLRHYREGRLRDADLDRALEDIGRVLPSGTPSSQLIVRAAELAKHLSHPIYDCLYLALAEQRETILVTADAEFVRRCRTKIPQVAIRLQLLSEFEP